MIKIFVDSSVFLKLLFNEVGASQAEKILNAIETGNLISYVTPLVLEEVSFKILIEDISSRLNTNNIWKIREELKKNSDLRKDAISSVRKFLEYIENMRFKGLKIESITYEDWRKSLDYVEKYGLLTADSIHLAVTKRLGINTIATFDEDFKAIQQEIKTIPDIQG